MNDLLNLFFSTNNGLIYVKEVKSVILFVLD